ncbi:ribosomal protection-like ABC-F family protein [Anaerotignum sp.]|uniref:ribosomal protection-like ABC-F family protein n=1 Tax=Anaerotignum sp. TaxID=2039241 RepID=UPI002714ECF3|nr:ABC-F type ribosomal protection protein [Anaerotignum sp.]
MSQINISNLTFSYDGSYDPVFENVSFQIDTDWKLGFTGRNGRGKTTFLNLLLGKYEYRGTISKSIDMAYFPYPVVNMTQFTIDVVENIYPNYLLWELLRELNYLNISDKVLYRPFNTLSSGEQTKILLAVLFLKENTFLLIDEPTNHLDVEGRQIVSKYLSHKKGFILVSHDRDFLDVCIDHILSINKNNIEIQKGNFSSWYQNKQLQDSYEIAQNENLKIEITRLNKAAKEKRLWADKTEASKFGDGPCDRGYIGHKAAKSMKRAKSIQKRMKNNINEKQKLLKNIETAENLKIEQLEHHNNKLISFDNVSAYYEENTVFEHISFSINAGDIISVCGKNGSGKSTILKLICRENISHTGAIYIAPELKISYISQDTSMLRGNLSEYAKQCSIDESLFKSILRKLDFSHIQFEKDISVFSAGQKKKVLIAKSLCEKAHIHIWDEPLNFVDVLSRIQLERLILEFKPTLLYVEHDKTFCENISTKKIFL